MRHVLPAVAVLDLLILAGLLGIAQGQETEEGTAGPHLLERAFENLYADDYVQVIELSTEIRGARTLDRKLQITRRQSKSPGMALVRFLEPFDVRHTSILVLENESASDDMFVYLPAVRITRRISAAQRADSFFGTDLNYEDIEPKRAADYSVRTLGSEMPQRACVPIEIAPKPGVESVYDKMRACIDAKNGVIHEMEFFRGGGRVKRLTSDLKSVTSVGKRSIPFIVRMTTLSSGSQTVVKTLSYELKADIPDSLFTTWNLEAGDANRDRRRASGTAK